jgi:hypothetical protein
MVIVIVAHAKNAPPLFVQSEKEMENIVIEPEFSGIGRRFEYSGKLWLYFHKQIVDNKLYRYMLIMKHKFKEDYYKSRVKIPFEITNRGVE